MATIEPYQTRSGAQLYAVRYRKPDNKQTWKRGFRTKRDARMFEATVEVSKAKGEYVAPKLGRVTVGELADRWLTRKQKATAPSHYRMLASAWRVHVQPHWGKVAVADVDLLAVEEWITAMVTNGAGPTTVLRAYGVLSGILADAVKGKRLAANPAKGVENLPRKTSRRHVYLSSDDVHRLADESGEHRALVLTLAYTGIRWGEAIALKVRDVEFLRRRLNVSENAVQLGVDHAVGPTKGRKARSVPVPEFVLDELSVQCRGKALGDLVFSQGTDYLPRPKSDGGWFAGAVKRAKVQKITPHDLLQRMLGHTSAKVTLDTYADLFDTDLDAVAERLEALAAKTSPQPLGERKER
jgi:integrase